MKNFSSPFFALFTSIIPNNRCIITYPFNTNPKYSIHSQYLRNLKFYYNESKNT